MGISVFGVLIFSGAAVAAASILIPSVQTRMMEMGNNLCKFFHHFNRNAFAFRAPQFRLFGILIHVVYSNNVFVIGKKTSLLTWDDDPNAGPSKNRSEQILLMNENRSKKRVKEWFSKRKTKMNEFLTKVFPNHTLETNTFDSDCSYVCIFGFTYKSISQKILDVETLFCL